MLLFYFLNLFVSLNVLFLICVFSVPMSEIPVDELQLFVVSQALTLSVICFRKISSCSPQHRICENSLRLRLQVNFSRDLFPSTRCLRHNQPGLQLVTPFSAWGSSNHPLSVSSGYRLCEDIHVQDHLWKRISHSESRVETANVLCHPHGLFLPPHYAEAMALWVLISCWLGKAESPVSLPILDRPIGLPIWGPFCLLLMARQSSGHLHLTWQMPTRSQRTSHIPIFM